MNEDYMTLSDYWARHPVGSRPLTVPDWADFNRWLAQMKRQVAKLADRETKMKWPISGVHRKTRRKVWFWPDGEHMLFSTDENGCVTGDEAERERQLVSPSERHKMTKSKSTLPRRDVALAELKRLQAELAALARFPNDEFPEHTVLTVTKTYKRPALAQMLDGRYQTIEGQTVDQEYVYVLFKASGQWWMTGQNGHQINGADWDKVIEFVDEDELIDVRTGRSIMTDAQDPDVMYTDPSVAAMFAPSKKTAEERADEAEAVNGGSYVPRVQERPTRDES